MAEIVLHSDNPNTATSVSNIFIDEYMSDANGEFVKIYLYLLRLLSLPDASFSISSIADKFDHTEKDIKRALCYWERMHLLRLEYDEEQRLTRICLLDSFPSKEISEHHTKASAKKPVAQSGIPVKRICSADDISRFREQESVAELLFITERYLARTLTPTDINTIFYLYDGLQFPVELIEYLIEYCVSKGHTSIRYIEKVALGWADHGIRTVEAAKAASNLHSQSYFTVMKALGISGRNLVPSEMAFIAKWKDEYGFSNELISEACQRTIQAIHQPSFEYADSILANWHKKQLRSLSEIAKTDAEYQSRKKSAKAPALTGAPVTSRNKFNNFKQRSYDYDELEKMLLTTHTAH